MKSTFSGKLLLFGEYSILFNGKAITLPVPTYFGELEKKEVVASNDVFSNAQIKKLFNYINQKKQLASYFNLTAFKAEISNLVFTSNIPQGYGMGSSGALVASLWDAYGDKNQIASIISTKDVLAELESFFHGKSSGIDPITSYLGEPLLIQPNAPIEKLKGFEMDEGPYKIGLLDLGKPSLTKDLVLNFTKEMGTNKKKAAQFQDYIILNNELVSSFLSQNYSAWFLLLSEMVKQQVYWFAKMLTPAGVGLVNRSIPSKNYKIKLCGSGGGGFLLVFFKKDYEHQLQQELEGYKLTIL